jgi:hypothetical protein
MVSNMTHKRTMGDVYPVFVGIAVAVLTALVAWESRPFVGDDLETLNGVSQGTYLAGWRDIFLDVSLDKWRPVNNLYLFTSLRLFGNSYQAFWVANVGLMVCLIVVANWLMGRIKDLGSLHDRLAVTTGLVVLGSSPFAHYSRIGVFGFLELMPIILLVLAIGQVTPEFNSRAIQRGGALLALATLIHERYFIAYLTFGLIAFWRSRRTLELSQSVRRLVWFPAFWLYTEILVLRTNPLRGGGDLYLDSTIGFWIIPRFIDSTLFLGGGTFGQTAFYTGVDAAFGNISEPTGLAGVPTRLVALLVLLLPILFALAWKKDARESECFRRADSQNRQSLTLALQLVILMLALILPAATVISRVEMRWLFGPHVLVIFVVLCLSRTAFGQKTQFARAFFAAYVGLNMVGLSKFDEYNFFRDNTYELIDFAQSSSEGLRTESYSIVVVTDENTSYLNWATNYGRALKQYLENPPRHVAFLSVESEPPMDYCSKKFRHECVWIYATSTSFTSKAQFGVDLQRSDT